MMYTEFIHNIIDTRGQWNIPSGTYFEVHHILPVCMGGDGVIRKNGKLQKHPNLIYLFAHEHFIAHKLLALENPQNKKLVSAWMMMAFPKGKTKRNFEIAPDEYEQLRLLWSAHMKQDNPGLDESGHPWNYGKTGVYSDEVRRRISTSKKGKKQGPRSEEQKKTMSEAVRKRYLEHPETFRGHNKGKKCIINESGDIRWIEPSECLPEGFEYGGRKHSTYNIRNKEEFSEKHRTLFSGENNPMFGKGHLVSGERNGHATMDYYYDGQYFSCKKYLQQFLFSLDNRISDYVLTKIIRHEYDGQKDCPYQYIIDKLTWKVKEHEN